MSMRGVTKEIQKKIDDLKVLIIDDQPEVRSLIRDVLAEAGASRTFEATNGKEAMQFIDADFEIINFIICDWNMPSMNGLDFLRQIRSVFPNIPFIMVTGKSDKNSVIEAKVAGVSAFIRKPFSPEQLETKLKMLVMHELE
jgi:two-component system chemotaxis response regulator CheY